MAKLIYSAIMSVDGFIEDREGKFDWAAPDEELHTFFNDLERDAGTYLYGRRMYEVMTFWENEAELAAAPQYIQDFGRIWRSADKIVYSASLDSVKTEKTRLIRTFDAAEVKRLKAEASRDIGIGGPALAAEAFEAGLVDECHLVLVPVAVGDGKPALPAGRRLTFTLLSQRAFSGGAVHLHYRVDA